jgi:FKBP-type peptidyl-prolyl cis-trans isomerase
LQIDDLEVGTGQPATFGSDVLVHYTGWLVDAAGTPGSKFDSSHDRQEPFGFGLGRGNVIAGWDEGVAGMRVGGKRRLLIPPDLAYGEFGAGDVIPPNAVLMFEIDLLEIS